VAHALLAIEAAKDRDCERAELEFDCISVLFE
jgi:hypothetical protein